MILLFHLLKHIKEYQEFQSELENFFKGIIMEIGIAFQQKITSESWWDRIKTKGVQIWTKHKYFHTEFIIGEYWISANTTGIVKHKLKPLTSKYDYFFIEVEITPEQLGMLIRFIENQIGTKYDWTGIWLSQFIGLGANRADKWFCSELVAKLMQICLVEESLNIQPHMTDPGELFDSLMIMKESGKAKFFTGIEAEDELNDNFDFKKKYDKITEL